MSSMEQSTTKQVPTELRSQGITPRLIRDRIWKPVNRKNEHAMLGIVGREGKGKSYSGLRIAEVADPTFTAERVVYDPADFVRYCRDLPPGRAIFLDEAGDGMGARTWYDQDQIAVNKLLQLVRDENLIGIFSVPNTEEADSQLRSRFRDLLEMVETFPGEGFSVGKWFKVKTFPSDPNQSPIRKYPEMSVNGISRKIERVSFTPPNDDLVTAYEERKQAFKAREYESTLEMLDDSSTEEDAPQTPKEISQDILDNEGVEPYVSIHGGNQTKYIAWKLIRGERGLSQNDAKTVKTYLEREVDLSEVEIE